MFASLTQVTVDIPRQPGQSAILRKLTGRELDRAQAANIQSAASGILGRQWHERVKKQMKKGIEEIRLKAMTPEQLAERENAAALVELDDPMNGFDRFEVVKCGLVSWSYDAAERPVGKSGPPNKKAAEAEVIDARMKAIDDLEDEYVDFFAEQIMRLTKPALYQTAEEREAATKNAAG